jgi:hypothetical protein
MANHALRKPSPASRSMAVRASTLKGALKEARTRYGEHVRIIGSRSLNLRQQAGLGQDRMVEVLVEVQGPGALNERTAPLAGTGSPRITSADEPDLTPVIEREVERIEQLVSQLATRRHLAGKVEDDLQLYPLAAPLLAAGASAARVRQLAELFAAEHPGPQADLPAAMAALRSHLRAGDAGWDHFGGSHVFLGDGGAGKSDLVLALAARLQAAGRSTLVLKLLPRHGGTVRRLQLEAAAHGYDAALIQRPEQLPRLGEHLARYETVLVDTPSLFAEEFIRAGEMQRYISQNETFHRHLVIPLDLDLRDGSDLWEAARLWNCDWTAVTRLDRTKRHGKLLDIQYRTQLPFSLCTAGPWPERRPFLARPENLISLLVGEQSLPQAAAARA